MGRPGVLLDSQFGARAVKASLLSSLGKCGGLPSMCFFKCEGVRVPSWEGLEHSLSGCCVTSGSLCRSFSKLRAQHSFFSFGNHRLAFGMLRGGGGPAYGLLPVCVPSTVPPVFYSPQRWSGSRCSLHYSHFDNVINTLWRTSPHVGWSSNTCPYLLLKLLRTLLCSSFPSMFFCLAPLLYSHIIFS